MKVRLDFVTNSSSSSYLVAYKLDSDFSNVKDKIKEEFGNFGLNIVNNGIVSSSDILNSVRDCIEDKPEVLEEFKLLMSEEFNGENLYDFDELMDCEVEIGNDYLYGEVLLETILSAKLNPDSLFVIGSRIEYTNEGDTDSENLFIIDTICSMCNIEYTIISE